MTYSSRHIGAQTTRQKAIYIRLLLIYSQPTLNL